MELKSSSSNSDFNLGLSIPVLNAKQNSYITVIILFRNITLTDCGRTLIMMIMTKMMMMMLMMMMMMMTMMMIVMVMIFFSPKTFFVGI